MKLCLKTCGVTTLKLRDVGFLWIYYSFLVDAIFMFENNQNYPCRCTFIPMI